MTQEHAANTNDVLLEAKDVTAGYTPGVNILNNCSLTLKRGEIVGIICPNGAEIGRAHV